MMDQKPGFPIIKTQISCEQDIVLVRQRTRLLAEAIGFENQDQIRLATAVSELARNVYQYAKSGTVEFFYSDTIPQTLFVKVVDQGPGISKLKEILDGVYQSPSGMGVGLLGSKKLSDIFEISSSSMGTQILLGKKLSSSSKPFKKENLPAIMSRLAEKADQSSIDEMQRQNRDLLITLKDLTSSNQEIVELNRELEETNKGVLALYAELDDKATALKNANEIKTSFLSNMTHEFRTPLSSIISLTRLLLERVDGDLTAEQERQVNYIRKSGESLLELVNDLLDIAKVESGRISVNSSSFHIGELLGGLRGMFRPILGEKSSVEFTVGWSGEDLDLQTDQAKLSQILRNLISNAIKFTEAGTVSVHASQDSNHSVHIVVKDSGIGIKKEYYETIFEDFTQIHSKIQKSHKGTGLGLPLSRKLARLLGGDIWLESVEGKGSEFHVRIPRVYDGEREAVLFSKRLDDDKKIDSESVDDGSAFKILLIDDDEPSRYILKELIASQISATFMEAKNGMDGLQKMKLFSPDVVFLDILMPDLNGFEILESVKKDSAIRNIPVVINTALKLTDPELQKLGDATAVLSKEDWDHSSAIRNIKTALFKAGFDYKGVEL
tara:strand:- start:4558 stop:6387 length:1830 start_codon:yes stop_codon:yes gene_type:complete